jgi:hypothetical protein
VSRIENVIVERSVSSAGFQPCGDAARCTRADQNHVRTGRLALPGCA